jgi:hypothetical protein
MTKTSSFMRLTPEVNLLILGQGDRVEGVAAVGSDDLVLAALALVVRPEGDTSSGRATLVASGTSSSFCPVASVGQACFGREDQIHFLDPSVI